MDACSAPQRHFRRRYRRQHDCQMQKCSRTRVRGACLSQRRHRAPTRNSKWEHSSPRRHASVGRPETCWSERRPRHRRRGLPSRAAAAEARFAPKTAACRSGAVPLTADDSRASRSADLQIVLSTCSAFSFFQIERARVRGEKIIDAVALQRRINPERRNSPHARALN